MPRFNLSPLEKAINNINSRTSLGIEYDEIKKYLKVIQDESVLIDILNQAASYSDEEYILMDNLDSIVDIMYPTIVTKKSDLDLFNSITLIYLKNPNIFTRDMLDNINFAFSDKTLVFEAISIINKIYTVELKNSYTNEEIDLLSSYLVKARQYYVDDRALFTSFCQLINTQKVKGELVEVNLEEIKNFITEKLIEDKKANGIYDIDEATIKEFDRKAEELGLIKDRIRTLVEIAENERAALENDTENVKTRLTEIRVEELKALQDEATRITTSFNKTYMDLLNNQKKTIIADRDRLSADIAETAEKKKAELIALCESLTEDVTYQLSRIQAVSNDSIGSIKELVATDENVQEIIRTTAENRHFLNRLSVVEKIAGNIDLNSPEVETSAVQKVVVPNKTIVVAQEDITNVEADPTINYYFDKSVEFKERIKKILDAKHKMEAEGEIFHEKFDDVLTMIIQNDCPYMYGPSGCGKTYMIEEQLAKLLGIPVITNGYIQYEQDVLGYNNAGNGGYVPSNFYRAYKFGNFIFFDELDNSNSNATTVLNSFLTRRVNSYYTFPNGQLITRHPNFRIITAGNTKGSGKTVAHNTRQKIDESVMQRLTPIAISYDNRIEKQILKSHKGWYEFATEFRRAIESIPSDYGDETNTIGTFTTRDAETIRDYLDQKAFTDEQLMDYQIIENKDDDYLSKIRANMNEDNIESKDGKKLLELFNSRIKTKKNEKRRN